MLKFYGKKKLLPPCHGWVARPFPSQPKPLFQSEAKCKASDMNTIFYSDEGETHYHKLEGFAFGTWKWPIEQWGHDELHLGIPIEQNNSGSLRSSWWIIVHFQELLQNITIHDSSAYYNLRQRVITIYDSLVITILDNCYYNLRQILQFTTTIITIHDVITIHDRTNSE